MHWSATGFQERGVGPGLGGFEGDFGHVGVGKDYDFGPADIGMGADEFEDVSAVEFGDEQIKDDNIRAGDGQLPHGVEAITCDLYFVAFAQKFLAVNLHHYRIIFDEENFFHVARCVRTGQICPNALGNQACR